MDDTELAALEYGEIDSPVVILALHGLFGSARNLAGVCRELANQARVLAFDLPGHGKSAAPTELTLATMAAAVARELDTRRIDCAALLGHSLGGKVAMALALQLPERVSRLLVADIAPVAYPASHDQIFAAMLSLPEVTVSRTDADAHLAQFVGEPGVRQFLLQNLVRRGDHYGWRIDVAALQRAYPALREAVHSPHPDRVFEGPALFLAGEQSDYIKQDYYPAMGALFPHYSVSQIDGVGHWLHAEKPREFNAMASAFLLEG